MVKYEVFHPSWVTRSISFSAASRRGTGSTPPCCRSFDVNRDGVLQLNELHRPDIIVLAAPEIGGLPYVVSGLVAAGGWRRPCPRPTVCCSASPAASANVYYKMIDPRLHRAAGDPLEEGPAHRGLVGGVPGRAEAGGLVPRLRSVPRSGPAAFFPALTLGIFWKREGPAPRPVPA